MGLVVIGAAPAVVHAEPSTQDTAWVVAAHQSNLTEIAAGQAAQQQAVNAQVKQLGAEFVTMHTQLDASLTATAQQLGITLPAAPSDAQQQTLAAVAAKSGAEFDAAWVASQIAGHQDTLAATQTEISNGSDPSVVAAAQSAAPVVQHHLDELRSSPAAASPSLVATGSGGQIAGGGGPSPVAWLLILVGGVGAAAVGMSLLPRRRLR